MDPRAPPVKERPIRVLLTDPSLFTAPYDGGLDGGLRAAGVETRWAIRNLRRHEEPELPADARAMRFYPLTERGRRRTGRIAKSIKGLEHGIGLLRLRALARHFDVVHVQWANVPALDRLAMDHIRRTRPVVMTVHDIEPLNGVVALNSLQRRGYEGLFASADRLIVHTAGAGDALIARGVDPGRIAIVPHGPLALRVAPAPVADKIEGRSRVVLFGRLQSYKGVDVLVEALGLLPRDARDRLEVVIAGEPLMPMEPILTRAAELGLAPPTLQIRQGRLDDRAMADLLGSADAFVFPYHAIEASGVLFLVAASGKWLIASALGAFVDAIGSGEDRGTLVRPGDPRALATALIGSIGRTPSPRDATWAPDWPEIGARTRDIYRDVLRERGHCL